MKRSCKTCIFGGQCETDWSVCACGYHAPVDEEDALVQEIAHSQRSDMAYYMGQLRKDEGSEGV